MSLHASDRRRGARVAVDRDVPELTLPVSATVQLLDISESGVLLASSQPLDVGRRAQLRTRIGAEPLTVLVEIRRVLPSQRHGPAAYRLGAEFVNLDEESRRKIEGFLRHQA
jgi:c-di-GMP-binding flagellar brake protein YcgR